MDNSNSNAKDTRQQPVYWAYYHAQGHTLEVRFGDYNRPDWAQTICGKWGNVNPNSIFTVGIPQEYRIAVRDAFAHPDQWRSGYTNNGVPNPYTTDDVAAAIITVAFPEFDPSKHVTPVPPMNSGFFEVTLPDGDTITTNATYINKWIATQELEQSFIGRYMEEIAMKELAIREANQRLREHQERKANADALVKAIRERLAAQQDEAKKAKHLAMGSQVAAAIGKVFDALYDLNNVWDVINDDYDYDSIDKPLSYYYPFDVDLDDLVSRVQTWHEQFVATVTGSVFPPTNGGNHWHDQDAKDR